MQWIQIGEETVTIVENLVPWQDTAEVRELWGKRGGSSIGIIITL